jgi:hypothetical protein
MKALAIAALAAAVVLSGSPALAQTPVDSHPGDVAQAPVLPAGTPEYDTFQATALKTILAYGRNWNRLQDCKAWACYSTYFLRIDTILTTGIKWMYSHPSLPCYQEQQKRVTKGLQELRGGIRMLSLAIQTGDDWRAKVARRKIRATVQIFENLPAHTCPA